MAIVTILISNGEFFKIIAYLTFNDDCVFWNWDTPHHPESTNIMMKYDDVDDDDVNVNDHDDDDGITWQWRQPLYDPKNFLRYHLLYYLY